MPSLAGAQPPAAPRASDLRRRRWCYAPGTTRRWPMIKQGRAAAMLPAQDLERAKAFYRDKLGLTPTREGDPMGGALYELSGGTGFAVFLSSGKSSGTHTQLALEVQDLDATVKDLRARGLK